MADSITKDAFKATIDTRYRVLTGPDSRIELSLTQVREMASTPGYETFALDFRGPRETPLPQMTYTMENDQIGELELFIVPVGADDKDYYYEAVFNRLTQQE